MAPFTGHVLPGSIFILFGFWLSVKYSLKYHSRRLDKKVHEIRRFSQLEVIEGSVKIFAVVGGMLAEQFLPEGPHLHLYAGDPGTWVKPMNWQHTTMYLFFGISGVVDVIAYSTATLPKGLDRLMLSIALFIEGFLFYFHITDRPLLDQHIHSLLLISAIAGAASLLLEVFLQENIILKLFSSSLALLQGTWLIEIGFVLYPPWGGPGWDVKDHSNVMFITMCFCWHYALAILVVAVNYALVYCYIQKRWANIGEPEIKFVLRKQQSKKDFHAPLLNGSDEE